MLCQRNLRWFYKNELKWNIFFYKMNSNVQKSEILICRSTLKILKWSLIWPSQETEMNSGKWYYLRIASFVLITSGWVVSVLLHLFMGLKSMQIFLFNLLNQLWEVLQKFFEYLKRFSKLLSFFNFFSLDFWSFEFNRFATFIQVFLCY